MPSAGAQASEVRKKKFVPAAERIATFDQDGTLSVEHPMYSQVMYILESVPALLRAKPELAKVAPFSTVLEILKRDRSAIAKLTLPDLEKLAMATLTGMPVDTFNAEAKKWLDEAKDPRWKKPYTGLTDLPMQEVLKYLRASGYKTWIVTGGGQDAGAARRREARIRLWPGAGPACLQGRHLYAGAV